MTQPSSLKYRAFLSYSHRDTRWARSIHRKLEAFPLGKDLLGRETPSGPVPQSIKPIFRDRDEFAAGHTLKEQTLAALESSAALIVVCSPAAAQSRYVNEEVRLFRFHHPDRAVVPIIVDGAPGAKDQECFPDALRLEILPDGTVGTTAMEILAADVRDAADGEDLALAKVVARLLDLPTDDVFRRAERARRSMLKKWVAALAALAIILGGLGFYADLKRRTVESRETALESEQQIMFRQLQMALSEKVSRTADIVLDNDPVRSPPDHNELVQSAMTVTEILEAIQASTGILFDRRSAMGDRLPSLTTFDAYNDIGPDPLKGALAATFTAMGDILRAELKDLVRARAYYEKAAKLRSSVLEERPGDGEAERLVAVATGRLGALAAAEGKTKEARADLNSAIQTFEKMTRRSPEREAFLTKLKELDPPSFEMQQKSEAPRRRTERDLQKLKALLEGLPTDPN